MRWLRQEPKPRWQRSSTTRHVRSFNCVWNFNSHCFEQAPGRFPKAYRYLFTNQNNVQCIQLEINCLNRELNSNINRSTLLLAYRFYLTHPLLCACTNLQLALLFQVHATFTCHKFNANYIEAGFLNATNAFNALKQFNLVPLLYCLTRTVFSAVTSIKQNIVNR